MTTNMTKINQPTAQPTAKVIGWSKKNITAKNKSTPSKKATKAKTKKPTVSTAELADQYFTLRNAGKLNFAWAETILTELIKRLKTGESIKLKDGRRCKLVNNFDKTNVAFRAAAVHQFELAIE